MVIKLYISGISGNKEVKKKQQRVQMILDSKQINYEAIDITEPGKEKDKEFMQQNGKVRESLGKYPLPPQIFNDEDFCGDYEDFDLANEVDELEKFLHIETSSSENDSKATSEEIDEKLLFEVLECPSSSETCSKRSLSQASSVSVYNPYEYHTFKIKFDGVNGLKEQIINTNEFLEENKDEEMTKSEVNGEYEAVPGLEPSSENLTETPADESVAPEKEESSSQENRTVEDDGEKETEENAEEKEEGEVEEAGEKEEDKEDVDTQEEEKIENPTEEKAPPPEENKAEEEEEEEVEEDKEEAESEKEEASDNESPQSEKSQED